MFLTVTIQTYNNADVLNTAVKHIRSLQCNLNDRCEILIVDNNSTDDTPRVISRHMQSQGPPMRSVFEFRQGLSHARNRALKEAQGEVVCFLDDDVIVDRHWLIAMSAAFCKYSADVVGGRSYLIYPGEKPEWLSASTEVLLSRLDHGDRTLVNTEKDLFGLNFAVRRELAIQMGGFRTDFGRQGGSLNCGEEIELLDRIRKAGGSVVYEPAAVVGHIVKPERLSKKWLLRRTYAGAVATERMSISNGKDGDIGRLMLHSARCWASVAKSALLRRDSARLFFEKQYCAAYSLGRLSAALANRASGLQTLKRT